MRKNCYGHPAASKAWSEHRNEFVMEEFNKPGWEIHRCTYDPCLFYIKKDPKMGWTQDTVDSNYPNSTSTSSEIGGSKAEVKFLKDGSLDPAYRPSKHEAWMSIHTDDCDIVGTSDTILNEIFQIIDNKWKSKIVPASYMLGIKRETNTPTGPSGVWECTHTMQAYVEGMFELFSEHISDKHRPKTPFPPGCILYKDDCETDEEAQDILDNKKYRTIVGKVLWACRGVYPECAYGCSQLSKVLSRPSTKAWNAALHMVQWMYLQRNRVNEVLCAICIPMCLNAEMFWSVLHFRELEVFLGVYKSYKSHK